MENQLVETNNIDAFSDDKLNRKFLAENLKRILLNTDYNVFSINAPWGGGKSYFIENLAELIGDEAVCISYNAWESDFYNNPLIPLVTELMASLDKIIAKEDDVHKDLIKIMNIVNNIFQKTNITAGINQNLQSGNLNIGITYDTNKKSIESSYIELKNLKKELRQGLIFIQKRINKNIIIFVDDLDRCNPKYAIETLETIKHFFGIKNIIFVLAVDKKQVENIVKTIYGIAPETSDIEGYLKKFIDVEFNLPAPVYADFIQFQLQQIVECSKYFIESERWYCFGVIEDNNIINIENYNDVFIKTVQQLVTTLDFTPRMIEKLFMRVKLTIESLDDEDLLLPEIIFILNALYICDKKAFDSYINATPYNSNLDNLGMKINNIYPFWTGLLNNFNLIQKNYKQNHTGEPNLIDINAESILEYALHIKHRYPYREHHNLNKYLKSYASKIEFIGSMD